MPSSKEVQEPLTPPGKAFEGVKKLGLRQKVKESVERKKGGLVMVEHSSNQVSKKKKNQIGPLPDIQDSDQVDLKVNKKKKRTEI